MKMSGEPNGKLRAACLHSFGVYVQLLNVLTSQLVIAYNLRMLSTTASCLFLDLSSGGHGLKLLLTVVTAKVERLSIAFGMESG